MELKFETKDQARMVRMALEMQLHSDREKMKSLQFEEAPTGYLMNRINETQKVLKNLESII